MTDREESFKRLMMASLDGDKSSYHRLLEDLARYLRGHVARLLHRAGVRGGVEPEDVVQDVLIAIHTRRHTYDPSFPVTVWVHAIARHKVIDHLRSRGRSGISVPIDDLEHVLPAAEASPTARADVDRVLAALPASLRGPFAAVKLDGHSIADAAAAAGMSETALKVAIHRGMKKLSSLFGS